MPRPEPLPYNPLFSIMDDFAILCYASFSAFASEVQLISHYIELMYITAGQLRPIVGVPGEEKNYYEPCRLEEGIYESVQNLTEPVKPPR